MAQAALGVAADGNFGPGTRAGAIAFQKSVGLIADGIIGLQIEGALNKGNGPCNLPEPSRRFSLAARAVFDLASCPRC